MSNPTKPTLCYPFLEFIATPKEAIVAEMKKCNIEVVSKDKKKATLLKVVANEDTPTYNATITLQSPMDKEDGSEFHDRFPLGVPTHFHVGMYWENVTDLNLVAEQFVVNVNGTEDV